MTRDLTERKRAEEALRRSEERYRGVLDSMREGFQIIGRDWRYVYLNDVAAVHGRRRKEDLLGRTVMESYPGIEATAMFALLRRCMETRASQSMENEFTYPDGSKAWFVLSIEPAPEGIFVISLDITERKRAEETLRRSEEQFHGAFQHAAIGMALVAPDGRLLKVNPGLSKLVGYSEEELLARTLQDITHPDDRDADLTYVGQVLSGEISTYQIEKRYLHKSGDVVWILLSVSLVRDGEGQPLYFISQIQDITARMRAEQALRAQEKRFRSLIENSTDIIALMAPDGSLPYLSAAFRHVLGFPVEEWLGKSLFDLIWPEDLAQAQALIGRSLQSPGEVIPWQLRLRHADGAWRWLEGTGTNFSADPAVQGIVVNCRDITERKLAEEREKKAEEMFRQSQKLEGIGRLAGGVAHDFNNVLGVITGYGELMRRQIGEEHPARPRLEQVIKAAERAAGLTRQLLAFSRKQVMQPKLLDLNLLVRDLERMLDRLVGEDVEIEVRAVEGVGTVKADPTQIEQVIMNLVVNARDAMPKGGHLTIETANADFDEAEAASHPPTKPGRFVMLAVSDTGMGMDAETQKRVFEPFFTTKPVGEGTGLGLATVYGIVKQSGGHVWVYSEVGRGTTFKIYFPRVEEAGEAEQGAVAAVPAPRGHETVLLVEDLGSLREVIREVLEDAGYTVLLASHGEEALALVREHKGAIDLLLTDIVMPKLGGGELAKQLRALRPGIRVLYMSGYTNGAISRQGVLEEGGVLLQKPFTGDRLTRAVREALDRPEVS